MQLVEESGNRQRLCMLLAVILASSSLMYMKSSTIFQTTFAETATASFGLRSVPLRVQLSNAPATRRRAIVHPDKNTQAVRPMIAPAQEYLCSGSRLGNKMCLLAATASTAASHNMTFVWVKQTTSCNWISKLQTIFINLAKAPTVSYAQVARWKQSKEGGILNVFRHVPVRPTNANIAVGGFRQSWKYFSSPSEQQAVRKLFTFSTYYEEHVRKVFTAIHTTFSSINKPILVGLHMRLGDLLYINNGKRVADKPFYNNVLKAVKSHFNGSDNLIFVASSDSPNVGKQKLVDAKELYNIFWLSGTDLEDFATLSRCNHSITSGGTFGFWTSWLAGGETFYNVNVSIAGSSFDKRYISDNFNLPTWIPVSWI